MTIHVMLDLETWGTEPGSDLRSIGAVVFDPTAGTVSGWDFSQPVGDRLTSIDGQFYRAVDNPATYEGANCGGWIESLGFTPNPIDPHFDATENAYRKYPLQRDPRTVQRWSDESDEAQAAFANPVDLRDGLLQFAIWLESVSTLKPKPRYPDYICDDIRLWSHGPAFDPPILAAAYKAVGLPVPWHYRAPRDTRTAFDLAGIDDHSAWLNAHPGPLAIPHHALDDAICQARAVCAAAEYIRQARDTLAEWNSRTHA